MRKKNFISENPTDELIEEKNETKREGHTQCNALKDLRGGLVLTGL